ncbi:MAG: DUF1905 domain-containing protein [Candidatus Paceibacterota bacterium]
MMIKFTLTETVQMMPLTNPWLYVDVPLNKIPTGPKRGWGSVPIIATLGQTTWRTSIFLLQKNNYFIPLKKKVRIQEGVYCGGVVTISYRLAKGEEI